MSAPADRHKRFARGCRVAAQLIRTASNLLICATILANTDGIGRNRPGQVARLCGHDSQMAACGSHSAGMRKPSAVGVLLDLSVGIGVERDLRACWFVLEPARRSGFSFSRYSAW